MLKKTVNTYIYVQSLQYLPVWLKVSNLLVYFSGPEPTLFGKPKFSCMRLHYKYKETSGYFHTLRAVVRSPEEDGKGLFHMRKLYT